MGRARVRRFEVRLIYRIRTVSAAPSKEWPLVEEIDGSSTIKRHEDEG